MSGAFEAPDQVLRTSGAYRLVLADRLGADEHRRLGDRCLDPDFYGVFRPARGEGISSAVDKETALLLLTLREPGPIPSHFLRGSGAAKLRRNLASLIHHGVVEVRGANGEFRRGREVARTIRLGAESQARTGRLAQLSKQAVRWACSRVQRRPETVDRPTLMRQLYAYHRLPVTPGWRRRLGSRHRVERFAGFPRTPPAGWRARSRQQSDDWVVYEQQGPSRPLPGPFKLYVSPRPEGLRRAIDGLFAVLADCRLAAFKVAGLPGDVLRPDKLMVYTDRLEALHDVAQRLGSELEGLEPHGVPFSAEISGEGLLSWGMDQKHEGKVKSWRASVVETVAETVLNLARDRDCELEKGVWDRLRLQGLDVETWQPAV